MQNIFLRKSTKQVLSAAMLSAFLLSSTTQVLAAPSSLDNYIQNRVRQSAPKILSDALRDATNIKIQDPSELTKPTGGTNIAAGQPQLPNIPFKPLNIAGAGMGYGSLGGNGSSQQPGSTPVNLPNSQWFGMAMPIIQMILNMLFPNLNQPSVPQQQQQQQQQQQPFNKLQCENNSSIQNSDQLMSMLNSNPSQVNQTAQGSTIRTDSVLFDGNVNPSQFGIKDTYLPTLGPRKDISSFTGSYIVVPCSDITSGKYRYGTPVLVTSHDTGKTIQATIQDCCIKSAANPRCGFGNEMSAHALYNLGMWDPCEGNSMSRQGNTTIQILG